MNQQRRGKMRWWPQGWIFMMTILLSFVITCQAAQSGGPSNTVGTKEKNSVWYTSVCEGQVMDIQCFGKMILIEEANFGRTDDQTCSGRGPVDNTNCILPTTFEVVTTICGNRESCAIPVNTDVFSPDPCPGTYKFLELRLLCVSQTTTPSPGIGMDTTLSTTNSTIRVNTERPTVRVHTGRPESEPTTTPLPVETTTLKRAVPTTKPPQNVCPSTARRGIQWPSTTGGRVVEKNCPEGATGYATWACIAEKGIPAAWDPSGPDLSNCQSEWISNLTQLADHGADTAEVSTAIVQEIDTSEVVYGPDIQAVTDYMSQSVKAFEQSLLGLEEDQKYEQSHKVSQNYLEITSSFLDNHNIDSWRDMPKIEQSESAASILYSVEETAFLWADTIELTDSEEQMTVTIEESNVVMSIMVQDSSHGSPVDAVFPSEHSVSSSRWTRIDDQIIIPRENFEDSESGKSKAVFLTYNNIHDYLGNHPPKTTQEEPQSFVNSRIMSASLNDPDRPSKLKAPVMITFAHIRVVNETANPTCSYWDFEKSLSGDWANDGCKVIKSNRTHTVCSCNHLTNFAVLMNYNAVEVSKPHSFALSMITYFGFIVSCVCLFLAFVTFCMFKNLQNDRTTIHKNLCLTLMIAEIIFMVGITRTQPEIVCSVIAMCLHYFFLSAFAWMCLEGIQLYVMLVEVFEAESSRRKYYYPFGYGLPALVIAVSAALNFDGYGTEAYCWLTTDDKFIWAFIAPVCLIILVNSIFLTMAMYIMCRHSKLQTNPKEKNTGDRIAEDQLYTPTDKLIVGNTRMEYIAIGVNTNNCIRPNVTRSWLRGALVLLCLLGITWVFGLAYVNANMVTFAYIFTVFNALQGMFIFIFHCLMNDKVRKEYRRYIRNSTWLPDCIRNNYGGIFSSNSNQQQSFRSSSSGRGRHNDSKRMSNTTGSYSFEQRRISSSSGCRCSGEYMPIQSPPPLDEEQIGSYVYEEVPECGFLPTHMVERAERALQEDALRQEAAMRQTVPFMPARDVGDEGIGLELEGHPSWSQKPSVVVANADGDLARFTKNDLRAVDQDMRESGIVNEPGSPESDTPQTISYHVQRSDPELSLRSVKPLPKGVNDGRRESGIGASQSEGDQSSSSSDQMCPRSPVVTPERPSKAYVFPNATPSHNSMPDLVHPNGGRRAQFNEVPTGSKRPSFLSLPKKSNSSVGVGESSARRTHSDSRQRPDHSVSLEAELYVPQTLSRLETMI